MPGSVDLGNWKAVRIDYPVAGPNPEPNFSRAAFFCKQVSCYNFKNIYTVFHIKEHSMDFWILIGVVAAVWFILNRWVLPKLGVPT